MTFHKTGGNMSGAASAKPDITLNDYIARKSDPFIMPDGTNISGLHKDVVAAVKPKLTFKEWYQSHCKKNNLPIRYTYFDKVDMMDCWKAAQDNK